MFLKNSKNISKTREFGKKMTCEDPLASGYPTAVQLSRRSSRCVVSVSDSDSDPDSDPVTSFFTYGLSGKKIILSNTQICIGEYP